MREERELFNVVAKFKVIIKHPLYLESDGGELCPSSDCNKVNIKPQGSNVLR